jgi:hypothetical protein
MREVLGLTACVRRSSVAAEPSKPDAVGFPQETVESRLSCSGKREAGSGKREAGSGKREAVVAGDPSGPTSLSLW